VKKSKVEVFRVGAQNYIVIMNALLVQRNEIVDERRVDQCDTIDGVWASHDVVLDKVIDLFCEYCRVA
jgi:hypothetical protein